MNMDERVKKERALPKFNGKTSNQVEPIVGIADVKLRTAQVKSTDRKMKGLGMDNYKVHCLFCQTDEHLQMHAHRINGKMVGWIFVCLGCIVQDKHLNLHIEWVEREIPKES